MDSCRAWHEAAPISERELGAVMSLSQLHKGACGVVSAVDEAAESAGPLAIGDVAGSTIVRRLMELGFIPGERIEVVAELQPGGDPIAVRIGCSVFALRRREAQTVMVRLEQASGAQPR
jgi:ferrous iron transport protein A